MDRKIKNVEETDLRISATTRIWKFATVMLALCVPLVMSAAAVGYIVALVVTLIPLAVLLAAAFGTAAVWGALGQRQIAAPPSNDLKQLEERLANVEIINRYENALQLEKETNARLRAAQTQGADTNADTEPRKLAML